MCNEDGKNLGEELLVMRGVVTTGGVSGSIYGSSITVPSRVLYLATMRLPARFGVSKWSVSNRCYLHCYKVVYCNS